jgi:hypothetical protein
MKFRQKQIVGIRIDKFDHALSGRTKYLPENDNAVKRRATVARLGQNGNMAP